jgi:hypothetical protein
MQPTLVARATVQQITALLPDRSGRVLFATSNPGKVLRLSAARAERGTYTSDVRDAQSVATWGAIKWQAAAPAGTKVEISTRSGNTRTADETWSDWSSAYADPNGTPIPRALLAVACSAHGRPRTGAGAHIGDGGLSATQLEAARFSDHDPSSGDRVPASVSDR